MRSTGIGAGFILMAAVVNAEAQTLDCALAAGEVQEAICGSETLRSLNDEMTKLFTLALNGSDMTEEQTAELKKSQEQWLAERGKCTASTLDLKVCIANADAMRIHELRTAYAALRASDDGVSIGPVTYNCEGVDAPVSAVFINTMEHLVSLSWDDQRMVLPQVISGSGARYQAEFPEAGEATFWDRGNEALFASPGNDPVDCSKVIGK